MLRKTRQNKQSGFTIIEVLIVLAIAGLIMVVVFLAVPNLQRSQRNNARKTDASRLATAVSDFSDNNNGTLPATGTNWSGGTNDCQTLLNDAGKLSQLNGISCATGTGLANNKFEVKSVTGAGSVGTVPNKDAVLLVEGGVCGSNGAYTFGTSRQAALYYTVEASNNWTVSCIQAE